MRFSIIMPAYNVSEHIENSIKSVQKQTFKDYELIIIEDCSTDNGATLKKLESFKNINLICNEKNMGAGGARNIGIEKARGEYIIFLDSDDELYEEDTLKKIDKTIGDKEPDIVQMGFIFVGTRDIKIIPTKESCEKKNQLSCEKYINVWSKCWRREFITRNNIIFPVGAIYEDVPFAFLGISKAESYLIADYITHQYTSGRAGSNASKNQFKQGRDTVTCIENLANLKDKIAPEHIPFLLKRIEEQKGRLVARIDRVLKDIFEEEREL